MRGTRASMKKAVLAAFVILVAGAATAHARVDFNVSVGLPFPVAPVVVAPAPPPPVVYSPPPPAYYPPPPAYYPPPAAYYAPEPPPVSEVVIEEPPQFIYSPRLGFYVSVGTPYDMVYCDNGYYLNRGGYWYYGASYWGPWSYVQARGLPPMLHRHRYERIRYYRDREYRAYIADRDHYRGRWYRPEPRPGWERRHDRRDDRRDERREERRHERWEERRDRH